MDIEIMQTVYMLALTGSFTTTAAMVHCSQPTVSRRIKIAESELGIPIFVRHSNHESVSITTEGKQVIDTFGRITKDYDELVSRFSKKDTRVLESVTLGIAGNTMITSNGIDLMYSDFLSLHPNSKIEIIRETEENTLRLLSIGKIDYALFTRYVWNNSSPFIHYELNENLKVDNFARHNISIATSVNSEIANKKSIKMKELEDIPFVYSGNIHNLPTSNVPTIHVIFFEACRLCGFTTKLMILEHHSRSLRAQSVANGLGSTHCAIPEKLSTYSGVTHIEISDAPIHGEFFLVANKEINPKEFTAIRDWLSSYF